MAAADPGEVFIHDIAALLIFQPESTENDDVPDAEDFDDDASQFTTASINSVLEGDICDHRGTHAGVEQNGKGPKEDDEISLKSQGLQPSDDLCTREEDIAPTSIPGIPGMPPPFPIIRATTSSATTASSTSIPKGRSIAHHDMARKGTVYVSFDIETGGEYCGILQISAEMVRVELSPVAIKKGPSTARLCFNHLQGDTHLQPIRQARGRSNME